jgi:very-short-patch-repair endonuclease
MSRGKSHLEEALAFQMKALKLEPVREHRFHVERRWRFDFAFLDLMVAVEVEGLSRGKSRHTSFGGYRADCEKYNEAAILGWCVLRFTDKEIKNGTAACTIERALAQKLSNNEQGRDGDRTGASVTGA